MGRRPVFSRWIIAAGLSAFASTASADLADGENIGNDERKSDGIDTIVVSTTRGRSSLTETPAAVSVLTGPSFERPTQGIGLDEWLNVVPGVFFQNRYNFAQNLRISTRGFGARAAFGVRGIQLRLDGFPETLPDGQAQVDAVDLQSLQMAQVMRGPASLHFGNASGGVIALQTADGEGQAPTVLSGVTIGGDGLRRMGIQAGQDAGRWHGWLSLSDLDYQGKRRHSATDKRLLNANAVVRLADRGRLRLVATLLDQPFGQDPGALTRQQLRSDRWQASAQSSSLNAGQSVRQERIGIAYDGELFSVDQFSLYAFQSARDFEQQLPSSFFPSRIAYQRDFAGFGISQETLVSERMRIILGGDWALQQDDRQRYLVDRSGQITDQTQNEKQHAESSALFLQFNVNLGDWSVLSGLRRDQLNLSIAPKQAVSEPLTQRQYQQWSGMVGLAYTISPTLSAFANISDGFESPTFTEIKDLAGGSGFTRELVPARANNYELGLRGDWDSTQLDVNLFWIDTTDEIVVVGAFDGVDLYSNAGQTSRLGWELALSHRWPDVGSMSLAYTYGRYSFENFVESGESFANNALPGLPRHHMAAALQLSLSDHWTWYVDGLWVGELYADNANQALVSGYGLVNTQLEYKRPTSSGDRWSWSIGISNVFDQKYFANVRVNANRGAFYEPGPSRSWFAALKWQFQ